MTSDPDSQTIYNLLEKISYQSGAMGQNARKYLELVSNGTWELSDLTKYFSAKELSSYLKADP